MRLSEDEKNLLLTEKLKVPMRNFYHDPKGAVELLGAFLKLGFEVSVYFDPRDNKFKCISLHKEFDRYCPSISGETWEKAVVNCIYHRIVNGPHGNLFK